MPQPEKWRVEDGPAGLLHVVNESGMIVAVVPGSGAGHKDAQRLARLLAAAPQMRYELEALSHWWATSPDGDEMPAWLFNIVQELLEATS